MMHAMMKLAQKWHEGQFRRAVKGEPPVPYFEHPKAVVRALLDWGEPGDSAAVAVAWGHDLLEDTAVPESEILAASNAGVLAGIRFLTRPEGTDKHRYLQNVALHGSRDMILVKLSDRIQNSRDFVKSEGVLRAFRYLHDADCVFDAAKKLPSDLVLENAVAAWENLDKQLRDDARHDVIRGCMLGGAAGDALGSPVEFLSSASIRQQYGEAGITGYVEYGSEGSITDDTQMALFTAEGILRAETRNEERGICDPVAVMRHAYLRWLKTQGGKIPDDALKEAMESGWLIREKALFVRRAPGMTCISALENSRDGVMAANRSKGCGTVMRMAPAGLFLEPEMAYDYGCRFSALTHGHPTGITAGGAFAMLIAELLQGKPLEEALDLVMAHLEACPEAAETLAALKNARTAENVSDLGEGWVAEEALAIGVCSALKHTWDFRAGVLEAVNIDGDSDSTGSIAGNILGVINGESAIPEKWLSGLREHRIVSQVADDLWKRFECGPDGHVTEGWWEKYPGF